MVIDTCSCARPTGDRIAEAWLQFACAALLDIVNDARDGDLLSRLWLLSEEGAAALVGVDIDPQAARARLVDRWAQSGLRRLV